MLWSIATESATVAFSSQFASPCTKLNISILEAYSSVIDTGEVAAIVTPVSS